MTDKLKPQPEGPTVCRDCHTAGCPAFDGPYVTGQEAILSDIACSLRALLSFLASTVPLFRGP